MLLSKLGLTKVVLTLLTHSGDLRTGYSIRTKQTTVNRKLLLMSMELSVLFTASKKGEKYLGLNLTNYCRELPSFYLSLIYMIF